MHNLLLITNSLTQADEFLATLEEKEQLKPNQIYRFGLENALTVEEFRQILKLSQYRFNKPRLFVIYHFDQASTIIQNTFLKTLEEHQANIMFALVAANLGNILPTISSRCHVKTLKFHHQIQEEEQKQEFAKIISQIEQTGLASAIVKLGIKDKKIKTTGWLEEFLNYGYQNLQSTPNRKYLSQYLKRAIINLKLIQNNNLDPETALDQVFFS